MRYRFKGLLRSTGQPVEGHAHGDTPDQAYAALSEHGIITESLVPDPVPLTSEPANQPLASAIDSALDTAAAQVPFDQLTDRYRGKNVWVLDRDKIRSRVAEIVDQALASAQQSTGTDVSGVRESVARAIDGMFKDNRNLTSQVSNTAGHMDRQLERMDSFVRKAEGLLAQMTVAISRMGTGGGGGGGYGPRRYQASSEVQNQQNEVLLEIFKENLRLRGIEIDPQEPDKAGEAVAVEAPAGQGAQVHDAQEQTQDASGSTAV